jgi:hypothetical protein
MNDSRAEDGPVDHNRFSVLCEGVLIRLAPSSPSSSSCSLSCSSRPRFHWQSASFKKGSQRHSYGPLLVSIPGIAQVSAMQLLAELSTLPSDLTVREWVAHSGLDPAHEISGSSVRKASRISRAGNRHLRRALYMPALVASRCDPHAKAFFEDLLARNKARLQALIAVARKLLHAIYGIFRSGAKYEGTKLFPRIALS